MTNWQHYYKVVDTFFGWLIFYSDEHETLAGIRAYSVSYRTEKNAIRGAERLYRRSVEGAFEIAFELDVDQ